MAVTDTDTLTFSTQMAVTTITVARSLSLSNFHSSLSLRICNRLFSASRFHFHLTITTRAPSPRPSFLTLPTSSFTRPFSSSSRSSKTVQTIKRNSKLVNFYLSDSESDDEDSKQTAAPAAAAKVIDKSKLPPPYDPFSKKPVIEEPEDPKNLQEVFHKISTEGLFNNAVKMFDALSKDGLTHEALELFGQIKDKGHMPDVVAHTAVVEAYVNAGQAKEALRVYLRMLAAGVLPNAYTYAVLIKGLANSENGKLLGEAKKYVLEMMGKGMRPNAGTYVAVFEAFAREGKAEEGREFLEEMKARGFVPNEKAVKEVLRDKRDLVVRSIMDILFGK